MRLRRIAETPARLREWPRELPDEITLRPYSNRLGECRFIVEARNGGRLLGDKDFAALEDARAFAKLEAGWNRARLVDLTNGKR